MEGASEGETEGGKCENVKMTSVYRGTGRVRGLSMGPGNVCKVFRTERRNRLARRSATGGGLVRTSAEAN